MICVKAAPGCAEQVSWFVRADIIGRILERVEVGGSEELRGPAAETQQVRMLHSCLSQEQSGSLMQRRSGPLCPASMHRKGKEEGQNAAALVLGDTRPRFSRAALVPSPALPCLHGNLLRQGFYPLSLQKDNLLSTGYDF